MNFVFPPNQPPSAEVHESDKRFPIRRIFCVGQNYAAHAREMGTDPNREAPFFFMKPADSAVDNHAVIPYPPQTNDLQFEVELVVAIGRQGRNIAEADALSFVWGYAIGNDLTRRDLQASAKKMGRPWDWAKGFDRSAVIGPIHPVSMAGHPKQGFIRLFKNDELKQDGDLSQMIRSVPEIISFISQGMTLMPGDLIMTGTPAGVGPLVPGDRCLLTVETLGEVTFSVSAAE